MDEERFEQLYNKILDGENWDYSTLDELICLSWVTQAQKPESSKKNSFPSSTNGK